MRARPRPRLQDQGQDQNRSHVEPLPSECMSYKIMWQTTASSSIKLCGSDNHVSLSPRVVWLLMLAVNYCKKNKFKKMLWARSFNSDQDQHNRPKTKNKACQSKTTTKTIFCWSETGLVDQSLRPYQWFIVWYNCSVSAAQWARGIGHSVDCIGSWIMDVSG